MIKFAFFTTFVFSIFAGAKAYGYSCKVELTNDRGYVLEDFRGWSDYSRRDACDEALTRCSNYLNRMPAGGRYRCSETDRNFPRPRPPRDDVIYLTCESRNYDYKFCHCPGADRFRVRISREFSHSQCIQGRNWGVDRDGIWVEDGCRAEFRLTPRRRRF